jgi:MoaA/NifB/PqqE/SkfB family radical SAM enzyme
MSALVCVWRVTSRCDLACPFCAFDRTLKIPRLDADAAEGLRFFGLLREAWPDRDVLVSFLGGEPALWGPLIEVNASLRALGFRTSLTTNGRALRRLAWREWAAANLDEITVSIDGIGSAHDDLRSDPGGYADTIAALRELGGRGGPPYVRVNTVVMRQNVGGFADLVAALAEAGVHEVTFNALGGRDRPEFHPDHALRAEDVDRLAEELPALRARFPALRIPGGPGYLARMRASALGGRLPVEDCGPARTFLFVEADGRVAPCHFTVDDYGVPSASLRSPEDLRALPARFAAARQRRSRWCDDCPSTQVHEKFAS